MTLRDSDASSRVRSIDSFFCIVVLVVSELMASKGPVSSVGVLLGLSTFELGGMVCAVV